MSNVHIPESAKAQILTTDEFLHLEKQRNVKSFVDQKMTEGKASHLNGWRLSDILEDVMAQYGEAHKAYARDYIIKDVCGIKKAPSKTRL